MTTEGIDAAPDTAAGAPATIVISQRVKSDRVEEYRDWQRELDGKVAQFPGFLGTESVPPPKGEAEWTVLYRFRTKPELEGWLSSSDRADMLARGKDLFDGLASQQVLIGERRDQVSVVVSHQVTPDREEAFLDWQEQMVAAERAFPGFGGAELFRPVPGVQEEWTAVFNFDTEEHLSRWLESPQRQRLLEEGRDYEFELHRVPNSFGSWFSGLLPTGEQGTPQWKTALSVLVGLYPTVVLLTLAISEIWPHGKLWATLLVGNILSVTLLTWVVMPIVTRALAWWLKPEATQAGQRLDVIGAVVSIAFLTLAALVFWLVTTQIWTLP